MRDLPAGALHVRDALTVQVLPFVRQDQYDPLLWCCDFNAVRGEDSFVRAQWAGRPMLWHIYQQDEDIHLDKLEAFLALYTKDSGHLRLARRSAVSGEAWNAGETMTDHWHSTPQTPARAAKTRRGVVSGTGLADRSCRSAGTVLCKLDMIRGLDFRKSIQIRIFAMKTGKELKPGTVIRIDNDPWLVQKAEFTKSGRNSAIMKTKLKNLLTGYKTETVYSADDKLDDVILDRKEATLSFISGDSYTFMDTTDYTMYELNAEDIESVLPFIEEGMTDVCEAVFFEGRLVSVELPTTIVRQVDYTEGSARGDTSGKVMKPAKLKNGTELSVADFIEIGDMIEIDTREGGSYKGRAK